MVRVVVFVNVSVVVCGRLGVVAVVLRIVVCVFVGSLIVGVDCVHSIGMDVVVAVGIDVALSLLVLFVLGGIVGVGTVVSVVVVSVVEPCVARALSEVVGGICCCVRVSLFVVVVVCLLWLWLLFVRIIIVGVLLPVLRCFLCVGVLLCVVRGVGVMVVM